MAPIGYVNLSLTPEARDALEALTAHLAAQLRRRISNSEALVIARRSLAPTPEEHPRRPRGE